MTETVTPQGLVMFLVNQRDTEPATAALVRIVVEGRGPAITQAAEPWSGPGAGWSNRFRRFHPISAAHSRRGCMKRSPAPRRWSRA